MWFSLHPAEPDFVERAPFRFDHRVVLAAKPARVFEVLANGATWRAWFHELESYEWTSPPPHEVGATRTIRMKPLTVRERILVHEPPHRIVYVMEQATLPLARRYVARMTLEPVGERQTSLRWVAAYEPTLAMRAIHPVARRLFGTTFRRSVESLAAYFGARDVPAA